MEGQRTGSEKSVTSHKPKLDGTGMRVPSGTAKSKTYAVLEWKGVIRMEISSPQGNTLVLSFGVSVFREISKVENLEQLIPLTIGSTMVTILVAVVVVMVVRVQEPNLGYTTVTVPTKTVSWPQKIRKINRATSINIITN
jgi:hypothetical protein